MAIGVAKSELVTQRQIDDSPRVSSCSIFRTISGVKIERITDIRMLRPEWQALGSKTSCSIYQTYAWVSTALETLHQDDIPLILTGRSNGRLEFILPLVITGSWIKSVCWIGESHANIGSGLYSEEFLKSGDKIDLALLKHFACQLGSAPLFTCLLNQQPLVGSFPDPMAGIPSITGVNNFYQMDLSNGFDALLRAGNAKRKKSRFRSRVKQANAAGGYELVRAENSQEALEAVGEFLKLKEQRFKELGITDVFSSEKAVNFIRKNADAREENGINPMIIFLLKIGGKNRAVFAAGKNNKKLNGQLNAISVDELSRIGPGELLLHLVAEKLAGEGYQSLDLGVGNERYKISWCQHELETRAAIVPLNIAAIPFAGFARFQHTLKMLIRNNPSAWNIVKSIRRKKGAIFPLGK